MVMKTPIPCPLCLPGHSVRAWRVSLSGHRVSSPCQPQACRVDGAGVPEHRTHCVPGHEGLQSVLGASQPEEEGATCAHTLSGPGFPPGTAAASSSRAGRSRLGCPAPSPRHHAHLGPQPVLATYSLCDRGLLTHLL